MINYLQKKLHNSHKKQIDHKKHLLKFAKFGIKSVSCGTVSEYNLNLLSKLLIKKSKSFGKTIKIWNLIFVNSNLTNLSQESRMGKGKGPIHTKISNIKKGQILFEFCGVTFYQAILLNVYIKNKLPLKTKLITIKF